MKRLSDLHDCKGKRFLVRTDFNVPVVNGEVRDDFRILKMKETIDYILGAGGKVFLLSHIESEEGTLFPVSEYLKKWYPIHFVSDYYPNMPDFSLLEDQVVLFENTRKYEEEKQNNAQFAEVLASCADIYVNEAFSASHRRHASIVGIPQCLDSYAGFTFSKEIHELSKVFDAPHPFSFILGGAKFETKLPLLYRLKDKVDVVCIGGALANDFLMETGVSVGKSLVSSSREGIRSFLNEQLIIPSDVVVMREGKRIAVPVSEIKPEDSIGDVGPETVSRMQNAIQHSKMILWNGPLGNYEQGFVESTESLARFVADMDSYSIVGGGDTIASISKLGIADQFSFVSSGGGAMLEYLANGTLEGIEALEIGARS